MGVCSSSKASALPQPQCQKEQKAEVLTEATAEERALTQLKLIFDSIDADENKQVSKEELAAALQKDEKLGGLIKEAGFSPSYADLAGLDTNKDGHVSWEEFHGNLKGKAKEELMETGALAAAELPADEKVLKLLKALFDSIDANTDGAVSQEELLAKLNDDKDEHGLMKDGSFGQLVEEAGFNPGFRTFNSLDVNHDGWITWEEFEKNLRKAAKEEVKETGDVAAATQVIEQKEAGEYTAAVPVTEQDDGGVTVQCGCW